MIVVQPSGVGDHGATITGGDHGGGGGGGGVEKLFVFVVPNRCHGI